MKNLCLYIYLVILLIFSVTINIKEDEKTIILDGTKYLVSVDGVLKDSFPQKGFYTVKTDCTNADSNWNYQKWVAEIYNIEEDVSCKISFTSSAEITFAEKIKSLIPDGQKNIGSFDKKDVSGNLIDDGSTLEIITENGEADYRYRGIDPNNYVWFNNELWRIIGVFDEKSHGITNTHLVKIIRSDSIGNYVWDNSGSNGLNNYPDSDVYNLLNDGYFRAINATGQDYCYEEGVYTDPETNSLSQPVKGKCNFTKKGIQSEYKDMVEKNAKWFLAGTRYLEYTSSEMYNIERGTTVYGKNDTSIKTNIGLMYASDYGYAAPSICTVDLEKYTDDKTCAGNNWLKSNGMEWIITASHDNYEVLYLGESGIIGANYAYNGYSIRPTLYLKSDVYYIAGTGTQTDPYIISA